MSESEGKHFEEWRKSGISYSCDGENNNCDCFITFPFLSEDSFSDWLNIPFFHISCSSLLNWSRFPIIIIGSFHEIRFALYIISLSRPSQVMQQWKQKLLLVSWLFLGSDLKESRLKDEIHDSSRSFSLRSSYFLSLFILLSLTHSQQSFLTFHVPTKSNRTHCVVHTFFIR